MTHDKLTRALDALSPARGDVTSHQEPAQVVHATAVDVLDVAGIDADVFLRDSEANPEALPLTARSERSARNPAYVSRKERQQDHRYPLPGMRKAMSIATAFSKEGSGTYPPDPHDLELVEGIMAEMDAASCRHEDKVKSLRAEAYVLSAKRQVFEVETEMLGTTAAVTLRLHDVLSARLRNDSPLSVLYAMGVHADVSTLLAEARARAEEAHAPLSEARRQIADAEASRADYQLLVDIHAPLQAAKEQLRAAQGKFDEARTLIAAARDDGEEVPLADAEVRAEESETADTAPVPERDNLNETQVPRRDLDGGGVITVLGLDSFSVVKGGVDEGESPVFLAGHDGVAAIDLIEFGSPGRSLPGVRVCFADSAIRIFPMQSVWALGKPIRRERQVARGWTRAGEC